MNKLKKVIVFSLFSFIVALISKEIKAGNGGCVSLDGNAISDADCLQYMNVYGS